MAKSRKKMGKATEYKLLASQIIDDKRFRFDESLDSKVLPILIKSGVLTSHGNTWILKPDRLLAEHLLDGMDKKLNSSTRSEASSSFKFFQRIEKYFQTEGYHQGKYETLSLVLDELLIEADILHKGSLHKLWNNVSKRRTEKMYQVSGSLSRILPRLRIRAKDLSVLLIHVLKKIRSKKATYDGNTGKLLDGVYNLTLGNPSKGKALLSQLITAVSDNQGDLPSAILRGLYDSGHWGVTELIELVKKNNLTHNWMIASSRLGFKSDSDVIKVQEFVDDLSIDDQQIRNMQIWFHISLLDERGLKLGDKTTKTVINRLKKVLNDGQEKDLDQLSWAIRHHRVSERLATELINTLANRGSLNESALGLANHLVDQLNKAKPIFGFLREYILQNPSGFKLEGIESGLGNLRLADPVGFSDQLILVLTDNSGAIRTLGTRILRQIDSSARGRAPFLFSVDLMGIKPVNQYKLWATVLMDYQEPKYSLPMLLPLRKATNEFVREGFLCRLEDYTFNYGKSVIEVLEEHLDKRSSRDRQILLRIKKSLDEILAIDAARNRIKELDPYYSQGDLLDKYQKTILDKRSEMLEQAQEKSILARIGTNVLLMKGGGWKMESRDEIQQLGTVSSSFQLPLGSLIEPERFDFEVSIQGKEDWTKQFEAWEARGLL